MNQTTDLPPAAGDQPPTPPPPPNQGTSSGGATYDRVTMQLRALRRSRSDRVVAGVCGGVARSLGLDPVFVRVLVAVLALIGGAGFVLYGLGWLLLAEDDGRPSVAERAATRTSQPGAGRPIWQAAALVVVTLIAVSAVDSWDGWVLLVLVVAGLVLWIDRRGDTGVAPQGYAPPKAAGPAPWYGPRQTPAAEPTTYPSTGSSPTGYGATAYSAPTYAPPAYSTAVPVSPPRPPRRPRSVLLAATLSCALIGVGVLAAVASSGADVPPAAYPALALAVVGAGLVLGAWFGRSRFLLVVGLLLALATGATAAADRVGDVDDDRVDLALRPLTVAALPTPSDYGVGEVTYDLTGIDFASQQVPGRPTEVDLSIGAGQLVVIVPRDLDVTVDADAGVGELNLFGRGDSGVGNSQTVTDLGGDGPGGGRLQLSVSTGIGSVEVRRG